MKKKLLSIALAAVMATACASAVIAEDKTPTVFVNSSEIFFEDQEPVILGEGTTLIPARGVFEAMGAKVDWDADKQQVEITSSDNMTIVRLVIGEDNLKVYDMSKMFETLLSGQDFKAPEKQVELDVPSQIMNERTMIPLRAISESLGADVKWNGEEYTINITSADAVIKADAPAYSLSASSLTAKEGETVDIYVNAANIPAGMFVSGVSATIKYDKENFEFVEGTLMNGETAIDAIVGAQNAEFAGGYLKAAYVTVDAEKAAKTDGAVLKLTFKSLNGKEGKFSLSNGYYTKLGYNTELLVESIEGDSTKAEYNGLTLKIDTNALVINDENATPAPEATTASDATTEPTASPEASAAPEATTSPEPTETAQPEATASPEATETPAPTAEPEK